MSRSIKSSKHFGLVLKGNDKVNVTQYFLHFLEKANWMSEEEKKIMNECL